MRVQAVKIASTRLEEFSWQSMVIWEQALTTKQELSSPVLGMNEELPKGGCMSEEVYAGFCRVLVAL